MATFVQGAPTEQVPAYYAQVATVLPSPSLPVQALVINSGPSPDSPGVLTTNTKNKIVNVVDVFDAMEVPESTLGSYWFDAFHVIPRSFDFGNLLSNQSVPIEVFNAFRNAPKEWTSFVSNAGAGTSLSGAPSLPTQVDALSGIQMTVDVSTSGDAFVDSTLDFGFSGLYTLFVPIEIQRIVMWGVAPEQLFSEFMAFLTNVHESKDGTEKRHSVRKSPRQSWSYRYLIDEGEGAQVLENLMFDFQALTFGVPVRLDGTEVTSTVTAGDTTINVGSTAYRDFRVGGLVVIFSDQGTFDVLEVSPGGIASTTIALESPSVNSYPVGTEVFPLRTCTAQKAISGDRWPANLQRVNIQFESTDNDVDLADLSAFSSFDGKLLLDGGNVMRRGQFSNRMTIKLEQVDGKIGLRYQDSFWERGKRSHLFTIRADGRQAIWEMRQMLHAIKGRWTSFYVPRDSDDLVAVNDLIGASNVMDVSNVGYAQFVRNRRPKNVIRISFVDGSTPLLRTIIGSSSPTASVDQLVVDAVWPSTITPNQISRIDYVEKVRFDTDRMKIDFDSVALRAYMSAPVKVLFE